MKISVKAAAKLNIFLDIIRRLDNGYHSLFMIMQSVGLYDVVKVTLSDSGKVTVLCSDPSLPCDGRNIAFRAACKFLSLAGLSGVGVNIDIEKNIPCAAGLAGGSADAAAVLYALNKLHGEPFCETRLLEIGAELGSDVPFCLTGGTRLAQNMGEVLSPLPPVPDVFFVLAKPCSSVSTMDAFAAFGEHGQISRLDRAGALYCAAKGDFEGLLKLSGNVFEQFVEVPDRVSIKSVMRRNGSTFCQMSGSGPTVFGIFDNPEGAEACAAELREFVGSVFVCRPVGRGVEEI